jgi:hypothetical protein
MRNRAGFEQNALKLGDDFPLFPRPCPHLSGDLLFLKEVESWLWLSSIFQVAVNQKTA